MPSALCLGCGARVDDDAPCACDAVGSNPYRDVAPTSVQLGRCPRCGPPLDSVDYADTTLDECPSCGGVFVEGWILDRLVAARAARISLGLSLPVRERLRETEVRYLKCPRCSMQMNRSVFGRSSGVIVDLCKADGVWFDAGELASVLEFIEAGGLERALEKERAEQEAELRRQQVRRELSHTPLIGLRHEDDSLRRELAADLVAVLVELWKG